MSGNQERDISGQKRVFWLLFILFLGILIVYFFPVQGIDVSTDRIAMLQIGPMTVVKKNQIAGFIRAMRLSRFVRLPVPVCNEQVVFIFRDGSTMRLHYQSASPPLHWYLNAICENGR